MVLEESRNFETRKKKVVIKVEENFVYLDIETKTKRPIFCVDIKFLFKIGAGT